MLKRIEMLLNNRISFLDIRDQFLLGSASEILTEDFFLILKSSSFFCYTQLIDIFCVDYPEEDKRFQINYSLLSLNYKQRLFIRLFENENSDSHLISLKNIFPSADWVEREVWDMFGVFFSGSNSLRRILTDYGFVGHPLRRDFPLQGFVAVRWSPRKGKIVLEKVVSAQEFRFFEFENPWVDK